jgi:DNA-binding NarL/FixJ family response regulator
MSITFDSVLIIDDMPLIAAGLREALRSVHPSLKLEYAENILTVLSAPGFENRVFDLIILGSGNDNTTGSLLLPATELKAKFPGSRIMIYTEDYDPLLIGNIGEGAIDACVHKHEGAGEVRTAWLRLQEGECYLSPMLHSLFVLYRLNR